MYNTLFFLFLYKHKPTMKSESYSCSVMSDSLRPMDWSLPGSSVHGILQARILEWVVILFSRGSSQPRDQTQVSCIAGGFFTNWATRKAPSPLYTYSYVSKDFDSSEAPTFLGCFKLPVPPAVRRPQTQAQLYESCRQARKPSEGLLDWNTLSNAED